MELVCASTDGHVTVSIFCEERCCKHECRYTGLRTFSGSLGTYLRVEWVDRVLILRLTF